MVSNSDNNSVNFKPISNKVNPLLLGHKSNEADFLSAFKSGNFHHAWLLVGDKGVGKATFAYRVARFIFATSPEPENKPMEFWTPVKRVKKSKSAAVKESSVKSENQDDMLFDLDDNDKLRATYIPTDATILEGDKIETSGLGGIYPKGITIGTVESIVNTKNLTNRYAVITPAVDFDKVETVLVITN